MGLATQTELPFEPGTCNGWYLLVMAGCHTGFDVWPPVLTQSFRKYALKIFEVANPVWFTVLKMLLNVKV